MMGGCGESYQQKKVTGEKKLRMGNRKAQVNRLLSLVALGSSTFLRHLKNGVGKDRQQFEKEEI